MQIHTHASRLGLSAIGSGFGSAAYRVSQLLYHAEFHDPPSASLITRLNKITARLVDRGLPPYGGGRARRFPGLSHKVLFGRPADGGFGALSWLQHTSAWHARWAARLVDLALPASAPQPDMAAAQPASPPSSPHLGGARQRLLRALHPPRPHCLGARRPAAPLQRAAAAAPAAAARRAPPAAPCRRRARCQRPPPARPLVRRRPALRQPPHFAYEYDDFAAVGICTIADVLRVERALAAAHAGGAYGAQAPLRRHRLAHAPAQQLRLCRAPPRHAARGGAVERAASWLAGGGAHRAGGGAGGPAGPGHRAGGHHRPARFRWQPPAGAAVTFATLTVRAATALPTAPAAAERDQRLATFAALAAAAPPPAPPPAPDVLPDLMAALRSLWRLPWENARKEQQWRLAHDALPTAARLHKDQPCDCGAPEQRPGRLQLIWTCPVTRAVFSDIKAALAAAQPGAAAPPLARAAIWLARAQAGVHPGVCGVVCLAAWR